MIRLALLLFCSTLHAQDLTSNLMNFVKDGDAGQYAELLRYKTFVENESKTMTYKLCEGYRFMWAMGSPNPHGNFFFSMAETSAAWMKIIAEGAATPIDEYFGHKADLIKYVDIPSSSKLYWANSAYALFLINSDGFLSASSHCLNTLDNKDFNWFAKQILFVGDAANLSIKAIGIILGGEVLEQLLVKLAPSVFQLGKSLATFADRYTTRSILNYIYLTVGLPVADSLMFDTQNKFKLQSEFRESMTESAEDQREQRLDQLIALRVQLKAALDEKKSGSGTQKQTGFMEALKKVFNKDQIELFRSDYQFLKVKDPKGTYTQALEFMLYFYDHPATLQG